MRKKFEQKTCKMRNTSFVLNGKILAKLYLYIFHFSVGIYKIIKLVWIAVYFQLPFSIQIHAKRKSFIAFAGLLIAFIWFLWIISGEIISNDFCMDLNVIFSYVIQFQNSDIVFALMFILFTFFTSPISVKLRFDSFKQHSTSFALTNQLFNLLSLLLNHFYR